MKKLLFTISALFTLIYLRANPCEEPSLVLSELYFEAGNWTIELQIIDPCPIGFYSDSIWIRSSSGISQIKNFSIDEYTSVFVVTNDSMNSDIIINPLGDSIEISYKRESEMVVNEWIVYGNFINAQVKRPKTGQSIALIPGSDGYSQTYSLDKSPTIGQENGVNGMYGTITGHIFDKNNQLFSNRDITLVNLSNGIYIKISTHGAYTSTVYSSNLNINGLHQAIYHPFIYDPFDPYDPYDPFSYYYLIDFYNISPISLSMVPDSTVSVDIHLLEPIIVGINEIDKNSESIMKILPNPINSSSFNYEIMIPVKSSESLLEIYNMAGQRISSYTINESNGKIDLPFDIKYGIYTVTLSINHKKYSNLKVIIAK